MLYQVVNRLKKISGIKLVKWLNLKLILKLIIMINFKFKSWREK